LTFSELFAQAASRSEVVCTFLALLELIRMKQLVCLQAEPFAEIEVTRSQTEALGSSPLPNQPAPVEPVPRTGLEPVLGESAPVAAETASAESPAASPEEVGGNPG
jgi:hypothetical protein